MGSDERGRSSTSRRARLIIAAGLGAAGPLAAAWGPGSWSPARSALYVAVAAATAVGLDGLSRRSWWLVAGAGAAGAGAAASAWAQGAVYPSTVIAGTTVLAFGAIVRWAVPPGWPQRRPGTLALALGPLLLGIVETSRRTISPWSVGLGVLTLLLLELSARRPAAIERTEATVERGAAAVGRFVATVAFDLVMVLVIVPFGWIGRRFGFSALDGGWARESSAWVEVAPSRMHDADGRPPAPHRMGGVEPRPVPAVRWRGRAAALAPLVVLGLLWSLVAGPLDPWSRRDPDPEVTDPFTVPLEDQPAYADVPWARDLRLDLLSAWRNLHFNAASGGWTLRDVSSPYVNVEDGERSSVRPDPALGEPVEVWLLGGSAAFGAGQRDEHTIASELVRLAEADSIPLLVRNLAVPATVNWQSAVLLLERLAWDPAPDLVVVYDGANDLALQEVLAGQGLAGEDRPASLVDAQLDEAVRAEAERSGAEGGALPAPEAEEAQPATTPEQAGELVLGRYGRGIEVIRDACEDRGVPVRIFWQPDLRGKEPLTDADEDVLRTADIDPATIEAWRTTSETVRQGLPALEVEDLTSIFDGRTDAVYWDAVHTNESGATVAAEAIYATLGPEVQRLDEGR